MANKVSAQQIYELMHNDKPSVPQLTDQQRDAVELASVTSPELVVAGAGSGKTELMAVRVLWLVANGFARPDQILGLTFTRKAASELSRRIWDNLQKLRASSLWPAELGDEVAQPTVTTYNSYSNSLFRENALGLGYEAESSLITDAAAYQLARELIVKHGGDIDARLVDLDNHIEKIVEYVLALAGEMNDNLTHAGEIDAISDRLLEALSNLPKRGGNDFTPGAEYSKELTRLASKKIIAALADAYRVEKQRLGYVDYSDQVVLAERASREIPEMVSAQRARYSHILLDEYQDTSYLQTRLLSQLFKGMAVFAVGDPNQSIYGWRGASASNLANFANDFGVTGAADWSHFELSTSWRNPAGVLRLANELASPLRAPASFAASGTPHLNPTTLLPRPGAGEGDIQVLFKQDIREEAKAVAQWFAKRKSEGEASLAAGEVKRLPTSALLMRNKKTMPIFVDELEALGLDVEVVGLGGLLEMPEIVDLVSALKVIHDPSRGTELVRLLTGARWRIGVKDIERLYRYANLQNRYDYKVKGSSPEDALSLIDTLDLLRDEYHAENCGVSEQALPRLKNAAELFANLRTQTGLPLVELVRLVERELWLDVEVVANPRRKNPMAHLNAFANLVAGYASNNNRPYLGALLRWLETVSKKEKVEAPTANPAPGVVQLLTIHSAKGLEWDNVGVASLVEGVFPGKNLDSAGWLSLENLPYPLRGDADSLPEWKWQSVSDQAAFNNSIKQFKSDNNEHKLREETRLVYVAVTRPKQNLLLTGSYWKPDVKTASNPSQFILAAANFLQLENDWLPECESTSNPLTANEKTESWPLDPLGPKHAAAVSKNAALVNDALNAAATLDEDDDIELLLKEREERLKTRIEVPLPVRINASGFKDYVTKPQQTAGKMLRPIPEEPFKATRAGTIFHTMMEQRFAEITRINTEAGDIDLVEVGESIAATQLSQVDLAEHQETIEKLQATFAKSKWANLVPEAIEIEIQLAVENNIFICKLDAVFPGEPSSQNGLPTFEVVDWKTGVAPSNEAEVYERSLQLALYRLAFATLKNVPLENVSACLYYVTDDKTVVPPHMLNREEILDLWGKVLG